MKKLLLGITMLSLLALTACSGKMSVSNMKGNVEYVEGNVIYLDCSKQRPINKMGEVTCAVEITDTTTIIANSKSTEISEEELTLKLIGAEVEVVLTQLAHLDEDTSVLKGEAFELKIVNK